MPIIRKRGMDVSVTDSDVANEVATKELVAVVGSITIRRRIVLGAIDADTRPQTDIVRLQVQYDAEKDDIADEAAFREEMIILAAQLT